MWKKIYDIIILITLLISVIFAGIQTYRVSSLSKSVGEYRSDLEDARRANERYADTFREAREANNGIGECLSEHISTLSQLREQLQTVRIRYEEMQKILAELENFSDSGDGLDDFDLGDISGGN